MRAARQFVDQPAFYRAEGERPVLRRGLDGFVMVEHPAHLGARKIGVEQQPGALLHGGFMAIVFHVGAELRGPAVLPHDGAGQRLARMAVPRNDRFALVGDSDRCDRTGRLASDLPRAGKRLGPYLGRIVFDPRGARIMLGQLLLGDRFHRPVGCENHRAGGGGPRVEDENAIGHALSLANGGW